MYPPHWVVVLYYVGLTFWSTWDGWAGIVAHGPLVCRVALGGLGKRLMNNGYNNSPGNKTAWQHVS